MVGITHSIDIIIVIVLRIGHNNFAKIDNTPFDPLLPTPKLFTWVIWTWICAADCFETENAFLYA